MTLCLPDALFVQPAYRAHAQQHITGQSILSTFRCLAVKLLLSVSFPMLCLVMHVFEVDAVWCYATLLSYAMLPNNAAVCNVAVLGCATLLGCTTCACCVPALCCDMFFA